MFAERLSISPLLPSVWGKIKGPEKGCFLLLGLTLALFSMASEPWAQESAPGDVNGDQDITSVDAAMVLQIADGTLTPLENQQVAADANQDGQITSKDAEMILFWAAQGFGVNVPSVFTDTIEVSVLSSTTGTIGTSGGEISLPSGVTLRIPEGELTEDKQITLRKVDPPSRLNRLDNKTCFQISPDLSYESGSTLSIPYPSFLRDGEAPNNLEGVAVWYYNPLTRMNHLIGVSYDLDGETLSIKLDQINLIIGEEPASFAYESKLLIFIVGDSSFQSAGTSVGKATSSTLHTAKSDVTYSVPYYEQKTGGSCWALCNAMLANYYLVDPMGIKAWDTLYYFDIPAEGPGTSDWHFWVSDTYEDYFNDRLGLGITIEWFFKERAVSLERYIKRKIDAGKPVWLSGYKHAVVVVGYRDVNGKTELILHDEDRYMKERMSWDDYVAEWQDYFEIIHGTYPLSTISYALTIPTVPSITDDIIDGISINILGKKDKEKAEGLKFVSPMDKMEHISFPKGNIRFSWYTGEWMSYFMSHDGDGIVLDTVPSYYSMSLEVRVANTSELDRRVKVKWYLRKLEKVAPDESGEQVLTAKYFDIDHLPNRDGITVYKFKHDGFQDLEGRYLLDVTAFDESGDKTYDRIRLFLTFIQGIRLNAKVVPDENNPNKEVVRLTWNGIDSEFVDEYRLYKKIGLGDWAPVPSGIIMPSSSLQYTDSNYNKKDKTYYAVTAWKKSDFFWDWWEYKLVITSDVASITDRQVWGFGIESGEGAGRISFADNKLYFGTSGSGTAGHAIYCLDAANGNPLWKKSIEHEITNSLAMKDGYVFAVPYGVPNVYRLLANDGSSMESFFEAESNLYASPAISDNSIYVVEANGYIYSIDLSTGGKNWQCPDVENPSDFRGTKSAPTVSGNAVFLEDGGVLYCLNASTGTENWTYKPPDGDFAFSSPIVKGDKVYIPARVLNSDQHYVFCIDATTGGEVWKVKTGTLSGTVSKLSLAGDRIFVGTCDKNKLYCIDASSGEVKWTFDAGGGIYQAPVLGDFVYFAGHGIVYCLDYDDGNKIWEFAIDDFVFLEVGALSGSNGHLYASGRDTKTNEKKIICLRAQDGETGDWPTYKYNFERTGAIETPAVIISAIETR